jgi:hypothetical protein
LGELGCGPVEGWLSSTLGGAASALEKLQSFIAIINSNFLTLLNRSGGLND